MCLKINCFNTVDKRMSHKELYKAAKACFEKILGSLQRVCGVQVCIGKRRIDVFIRLASAQLPKILHSYLFTLGMT